MKKILIVDDVLANRELLKYYLIDEWGYECIEAEDGVEGLKKVKENNNIDLILTDVEMPVMDGLTMSGLIKGDKRYNHIPIIFITARADQEINQLIADVNGDYYLTKPINEELLKEAITKNLK